MGREGRGGETYMVITTIGLILLFCGHITPIGLLAIAIPDFIQTFIIASMMDD